jgi:ABC-type Fe3+-hydroxamate transport system substrate-binding protein
VVRVVSLVPSVTETLLAWGVVPIAVTRFCEHPELPHVGGTKDPDVDAIVALRPDLVVVDVDENTRPAADALEAAGVALHVTEVRRIDDVGPVLAALAEAVGQPSAPPTAHDTRVRFSANRYRFDQKRTNVLAAFVPIWRRPWMTINGDTYGSSLLEAAGFANVFADASDRYPTVTLDEAAARNPDVVLLPSEPYPFAERHRAEARSVSPDVRLVDGRDVFWWGVRTPDALARLAQLGNS